MNMLLEEAGADGYGDGGDDDTRDISEYELEGMKWAFVGERCWNWKKALIS